MPSLPEGVRLKIERAKKHVNDLEIVVTPFCQANRNAFRVEDDPQTGEKVYRIHFRAPIPDNIPLIVGDAVHNLRSALDHLAWQLVEAGLSKAGVSSVPPTNTAFPVCKKRPCRKTTHCETVKGADAGALVLIESMQPCKAGNSHIGMLSELDNFDKHRLLIVAASRLADRAFGITPAGLLATKGKSSITIRVPTAIASGQPILKDGDEFCRIPLSGGTEQYANVQLTVKIAFDEPRIVHGETVIPLLTQLTQLVEGVVNQFIPFL